MGFVFQDVKFGKVQGSIKADDIAVEKQLQLMCIQGRGQPLNDHNASNKFIEIHAIKRPGPLSSA